MARKILLADDSVTAQNMGRKILADAGYDVATVNNGSAALKRITEVKPDLIVLDVYMPGYSGLEVCQRLKDAPETAHIPVLLTVGKLEPFKPDEARRVRADAHIVKPFEASELLTAITRLEDRMVPQSEARFATSVSGVERFGGEKRAETSGDPDTGWKSRLRFPSKKKKEEPEPDPEDTTGAPPFRDFRKGKKRGSGVGITVKDAPPPGQEPGLVPDIPRDITPEELDALSALAAKLDGPIPEAEEIAPIAAMTGPAAPESAVSEEEAAAETQAMKAAAALAATPAAEVDPKEASSAAEARTEPEGQKKEEQNQEQIAAESSAPAAEAIAPISSSEAQAVATAPEAQVSEPHQEIQTAAAEATQTSQTAEPPAASVPVNAAALVEEPAPVDRSDEPIFSTAPTIAELEAEKETVQPQAAVAEPVSKVEASVASAEPEIKDAVAAPIVPVSAPEAMQAEAANATQEPAPQPAAEIAPTSAEANEPAPTDEELAEALRLLTPATGHAESATTPTHGTLVAAGQMLAEEAARNAAAGPRWIAEAVSLSPEEASISLEAEMFRTFEATKSPARGPLASSVGPRIDESEARLVTGVSAIAAAVENRLAAAEIASIASPAPDVSSKPGSESALSQGSQAPYNDSALTPKPELSADAPSSPASQAKETAGAEPPTAAEEVASATFADAIGKQDEDQRSAAEQGAVPESAVDQDVSSDSGSDDDMSKDAKSKSGKSGWHQIRTTPAGAASKDLVESAKQGEEVPKAMAAAAAADGSASASAPDASTIASIVDSVMADLRPKIVEEIAKKLAGK